MDEWAINRERELQRAKGIDTERENEIRKAMQKAGLRHVQYGKRRDLEELSEEQQAKLQTSAEAACRNRGKIRPDEPDLLRAILKYYTGDVEQRQRIWRDFFAQWDKHELHILRAILLEHQVTVPNVLDYVQIVISQENPKQPFIAHALEWVGLVKSNNYSIPLLAEALNSEPVNTNRESLWYNLVREYEQHNPTPAQQMA